MPLSLLLVFQVFSSTMPCTQQAPSMLLFNGLNLKRTESDSNNILQNDFPNFFFFFFGLFAVSWAAPAAYGDSQARGQMRAVAASLHHSHSKLGSKQRL